MTFDILIKNGTVIDGSGAKRRIADLGIHKGKIAAIGNLKGAKGADTIEARDLMVVPGFIDSENHSDWTGTLFSERNMGSLIAQGITTVVGGHDGRSLAPLATEGGFAVVTRHLPAALANTDWLSFAEFVGKVIKRSLQINLGFLIGLNGLSEHIKSEPRLKGGAREVEHVIRWLCEKALAEGALGFSIDPFWGAEVDPVAIEILRSTGKERPLFVRWAPTVQNPLKGLPKVAELKLGRSGALVISHAGGAGLTSTGVAIFLAECERLRLRGLDLTLCFPPYSTTSELLARFLPSHTRSVDELTRALATKQGSTELKSALAHFASMLEAMMTVNGYEAFVGKPLSEIAARSDSSLTEVAIQLMRASQGNGEVFLYDPHAETLLAHLWSLPYTMPASHERGWAWERARNTPTEGIPVSARDQALLHTIRTGEGTTLIHPASFGAFPRFLRQATNGPSAITWEQAIYRITGLPRMRLGLKGRGILETNAHADVVVFDSHVLTDRARYEDGAVTSLGIEFVIVGGTIVMREGVMTSARAGSIVKAG